MPLVLRFTLLAIAVLICALLSLAIGPRSDVGFANIMQLLLVDDGSLARSTVVDLRLPRTLIAGLIGVNLGLAGLALQAVTRNPLASESVLGINQGAALGVAIGLVLPGLVVVNLGVMAIIGAILAGMVTFGIAGGWAGGSIPCASCWPGSRSAPSALPWCASPSRWKTIWRAP